jgi:GR25 family glycosyltransferase involved in LPS biosynthesis
MENIKKQEEIFNININIFEAIKGVSINQEELINNNILNPIFRYPTIKRSNEIACYMSHLTLLKNIKNNNIDKSDYSIILEDDFQIINLDFQIIINDALLQIPNNFDILFLGYPIIIDESTNLIFSTNLYEFNNKNNIYGAYAYLINNNNIDKIIENIEYIDMPIDIKYQELGYKNKLNIFFINPKIINTNLEFTSTIVV